MEFKNTMSTYGTGGGGGSKKTCSVLIVKIDVVHLEVLERLFTGFPYVLRLSVDGESLLVEGRPEFGTNKHFAPEIGILEERSQESLIRSLLYCIQCLSRFAAWANRPRIPKTPTHHRQSVYLASIGL